MRDAAGDPVPHCKLWLKNAREDFGADHPPPERRLRADKAGCFEILDVNAGAWCLGPALDSGYLPDPTNIQVMESSSAEVVVEARPALFVAGRVLGPFDELVFDAIGSAQLENVPELILAVRGDLERLADEVLGVNSRPEGWLHNIDLDSPNLAGDIVSDLEALADVILQGQRPETWITSGGLSQISTYRTMRFNLELLADRALGVGRRPNGWQGAPACRT